MDFDSIKCEFKVNGTQLNSIINLREESKGLLVSNELIIEYGYKDNMLDICIKNKGDKSVSLNCIKFDLYSTIHYKEISCMINPKDAAQKVTYIPMAEVNDEGDIKSHLFELVIDEENHQSMIVGFLGCRFSGNYIYNELKRNKLGISAVYNFVDQELLSNEEIYVDSLYIKAGDDMFSLFNSFVDKMAADFNIDNSINEVNLKDIPSTYSILYTYRVNNSTLRVSDKPLHIKVDGKKLYPVDIRSIEGKKLVFTNANAVLSKASALNLNGIGKFIDIVEENKLFNAYYELNKLLKALKDSFKKTGIYSDDYPVGLFNEKVFSLNKNIGFDDKKSLLNIISRKRIKKDINYDFFFKLLMQRIIQLNDEGLKINNDKIRELMSVVIGNFDLSNLKNPELKEIARDIDTKYAVIPCIERKDVFGILLRGRRNIYFAVFNLGNEAVKFYCDLSLHSGFDEFNGAVMEVYSNTSYLISDAKLYIRNLKAGDCCLFKKEIALKKVN
ncbi:hypothetical protein JK636_10890 [Clostridium sp. YIM B02515]|uniref:Uncharacterized protein n=1 Tax=Clostridium rhizosphaerae TaxID=2803861 RepID=A0ABS1TAG7_9CLOT|nr:hypothetical protein [Clostridium rhizosphaerae]MBL4936266.1 hypothetical protein [Clostridium rhizosphaerae]